MTKVIGVRKMIVIMWCVSAIGGLAFACLVYNKPIDASIITICMMIATLGGAHTFRQKVTGTT